MSKDNSGPAFPSDPDYVTSWDGTNQVTSAIRMDGMTKRELIAMHALQGIVSNGNMIDQANPGSFDWAAVAAVKFADALLAELAKE